MEDLSLLEPAENPQAELAIYHSFDATYNARQAIQYAERLVREGKCVIYYNTGQTERQLHAALREATDGRIRRHGTDRFKIITSPLGGLAYQRNMIGKDCEELKATHIIISSWEFAAKDTHTRNQLMHTIMYLMSTLDVNVTVFSQKADGAVKGYITAGRIGRLSAFADTILPVKSLEAVAGEAEMVTIAETPKPDEKGELPWRAPRPMMPEKPKARGGRNDREEFHVESIDRDENGKAFFVKHYKGGRTERVKDLNAT
jgi:hypothetical protein